MVGRTRQGWSWSRRRASRVRSRRGAGGGVEDVDRRVLPEDRHRGLRDGGERRTHASPSGTAVQGLGHLPDARPPGPAHLVFGRGKHGDPVVSRIQDRAALDAVFPVGIDSQELRLIDGQAGDPRTVIFEDDHPRRLHGAAPGNDAGAERADPDLVDPRGVGEVNGTAARVPILAELAHARRGTEHGQPRSCAAGPVVKSTVEAESSSPLMVREGSDAFEKASPWPARWRRCRWSSRPSHLRAVNPCRLRTGDRGSTETQ